MLMVLQDFRRKSGLSQEEIADKLGIDQAMYSKWERGERRMDFLEVYEVVFILGFDFSSFSVEFTKRLGMARA